MHHTSVDVLTNAQRPDLKPSETASQRPLDQTGPSSDNELDLISAMSSTRSSQPRSPVLLGERVSHDCLRTNPSSPNYSYLSTDASKRYEDTSSPSHDNRLPESGVSVIALNTNASTDNVVATFSSTSMYQAQAPLERLRSSTRSRTNPSSIRQVFTTPHDALSASQNPSRKRPRLPPIQTRLSKRPVHYEARHGSSCLKYSSFDHGDNGAPPQFSRTANRVYSSAFYHQAESPVSDGQLHHITSTEASCASSTHGSLFSRRRKESSMSTVSQLADELTFEEALLHPRLARARESALFSVLDLVEGAFQPRRQAPSTEYPMHKSDIVSIDALDLASPVLSLLGYWNPLSDSRYLFYPRSAAPLGSDSVPKDADRDHDHQGGSWNPNSFAFSSSPGFNFVSHSGPSRGPADNDTEALTTTSRGTSRKTKSTGLRCIMYHREDPELDPSRTCRNIREEFHSHLQRHHERRDHELYYCTRCFHIFENKATREIHTRSRNCPPKCVDEDCNFYSESQAPCRHCTNGNSRRAIWRQLFRMYRPGEPIPEPEIACDSMVEFSAPSALSSQHATVDGPGPDGALAGRSSLPRGPNPNNQSIRMPDHAFPSGQSDPNATLSLGLRRLAINLWRRIHSENSRPPPMLNRDYRILMAPLYSQSNPVQSTEILLLGSFVSELWQWCNHRAYRSMSSYSELRRNAAGLIPNSELHNVEPIFLDPPRNDLVRQSPPAQSQAADWTFGDQAMPATLVDFEHGAQPPPVLPVVNISPHNLVTGPLENTQGIGPANNGLGIRSHPQIFEPFLHGNAGHVQQLQIQRYGGDQFTLIRDAPSQQRVNAVAPNHLFMFPQNTTGSTFHSDAGSSIDQIPPSFITDDTNISQNDPLESQSYEDRQSFARNMQNMQDVQNMQSGPNLMPGLQADLSRPSSAGNRSFDSSNTGSGHSHGFGM